MQKSEIMLRKVKKQAEAIMKSYGCDRETINGALIMLGGNIEKNYEKPLNYLLDYYNDDENNAIGDVITISVGGILLDKYKISIDEYMKWVNKNHKALQPYLIALTEEQKTSEGCFIITAVLMSSGKLDNCLELNKFRSFRDNWLIKQPDGQALIEKYYSIAPKIVKAIEKSEQKTTIYKEIWNRYLSLCSVFISNRRYEDCKFIYSVMVNYLCNKYLKEESKK